MLALHRTNSLSSIQAKFCNSITYSELTLMLCAASRCLCNSRGPSRLLKEANSSVTCTRSQSVLDQNETEGYAADILQGPNLATFCVGVQASGRQACKARALEGLLLPSRAGSLHPASLGSHSIHHRIQV